MTAFNVHETKRTGMEGSIRVFVADENVLFVEGLKHLLNEVPNVDLDVVGSTHDGNEVLDAIKLYKPDLFITEVKLINRDGLDLIPAVRESYPDLHIMVISAFSHSKFVKNAFHGGTDGYVLKSNKKSDLFDGIAEVLAGNTYMGTDVRIAPNPRAQSPDYQNNWELEDAFLLKNYLTKRELEILTQIALAKNNKQIAKELFISDQTVSVHRKNIMRKLNVSNTASLIKIALDHGLVT